MASFTDQIQTFNPYVSKSPLIEAMVTVGTQKQQQYDQGVQKIQGYIDSIAGMDVVTDADKKYLQSKLNDLGSKLKTVAAGDFSNQQLVNSVGGMATQIIKDPTVQNAVYSTANYRKELSRLQKDIDEGKSNPANIDYFNKRANTWLSSDKPGQKFSGSYIPYFDVQKYAKETFDAIKPDNLTIDQVYETDTNGNIKLDKLGRPIFSPVMKRLEQEGRFPEKVRQTIDQIFSDARVSQQLDISGQYEYKNYSPELLSQKINLQREDLLSKYDNEIYELGLKKGTGKDVQAQIDALELKKNNIKSQYDDLIAVAQDNPDSIRSLLYKNDVRSRFTTMFSEMKTKSTMENNPGWESNFKLQKEANEQSRWAQGMAWDVKKFNVGLNEKEKDRQLQILLAQMRGKKGKGVDTDGDGIPDDFGAGAGYEQADMPGDIDLIARFESDLTNAADTFTNASDNFIWSAVLSKIPGNQAKLDSMMKQGIGKDQAISNLIDGAAVRNKETPASFRARWGDKSTVAYHNMDPKQRKNNPDLEDAYHMYTASKRNYDMLNTVKTNVDEVTGNILGKDVDKAKVIEGIKPSVGIINGKRFDITPEDFYDMAIYLKGNQSSVGFLNDKTAREEAKKAEARLDLRGKKELLPYLLEQQGLTTAGPITAGIRAIKGAITGIKAGITPGRPVTTSTPLVDFSQVNKIYDKLGDEYAGALKTKANVVKGYYNIQPNLKAGLLTGDAEEDRSMVDRLTRYAANYNTSGKNLSTDFKTFVENVGGKDVTYEAQVISGPGSKPLVEIVAYGGEDSKRLGGMIVADDEAKRIGINPATLYEPKEITYLKTYLQANGDQTSKGDPKEKSTYIQGDAYLQKPDFINMKGSNYDVKANIVYKNGLYYANIFGTDGIRSGLMTMPGSPNLQAVVTNLRNNVNPQWIEALLTER
jgi:hypothetical protein